MPGATGQYPIPSTVLTNLWILFIAEQEGSAGEEKTLKLLVVGRRGKLIKKISLGAIPDTAGIAHMVYGPDERTLFIPTFGHLDPSEDTNAAEQEGGVLSLLEVDIDRGNCYQVFQEHVDKDVTYFMQPSISPDGKYLAASIPLPKGSNSSLLYLVDLTSPQRKVTRVLLPGKPEPAAALEPE